MVVITASMPKVFCAGKNCKCFESDKAAWMLVLKSQQFTSCYLDMNTSATEHTVL